MPALCQSQFSFPAVWTARSHFDPLSRPVFPFAQQSFDSKTTSTYTTTAGPFSLARILASNIEFTISIFSPFGRVPPSNTRNEHNASVRSSCPRCGSPIKLKASRFLAVAKTISSKTMRAGCCSKRANRVVVSTLSFSESTGLPRFFPMEPRAHARLACRPLGHRSLAKPTPS